MKNLITYESVGNYFMKYLKERCHTEEEMFDYGFGIIAKSMFDGVTLASYSETDLLRRIYANHKTITYVQNVDVHTRYITEDSCHNIRGYKSLFDVNDKSNVNLVLRKLGSRLMNRMYEGEYSGFMDYLYPNIISDIYTMTREYIGAEGDIINVEILDKVWETYTLSKKDFIYGFEHIMSWDNCEDFIADTLCDVVLHPAELNVEGDYKSLSEDKIDEICDNVSSETWTNIFLYWINDEKAIREKRMELGLQVDDKKDNSISFNELLDKVKNSKVGTCINFTTSPLDENDAWVFSVGKEEIFGEEFIVFMPNSAFCNEALCFKDSEYISYEDIEEMIENHDSSTGKFYITNDFD